MKLDTKKMAKKTKICLFTGIIVVALTIGGIVFGISRNNDKKDDKKASNSEKETEKLVENETEKETEKETESDVEADVEENEFVVNKSLYFASNNTIDMLDLYFMKVENKKQNMVYSPLSAKYALSMLAEGADGDAKAQLMDVLSDYTTTKYNNSEKLSLANAFFIKDTYKDSIKQSYIDNLKDKYDADVKIESFATPDSLNEWIKAKSLGLLENIAEDISNEDIILVNTLAIDLNWKDKFANKNEDGIPLNKASIDYLFYNFGWYENGVGTHIDFQGKKVDYVSLTASYNKYDIMNELGEDKIREILRTEADKYLEANPDKDLSEFIWYGWAEEGKQLSVDEQFDLIVDTYIKELNSYYMDNACSTDFSFFVDDNVKVLAKDLEEVDGTSLQYIGIMPVKEDLSSYVNNVTADDIAGIIGNLKEAKSDSFKDGVITKIHGTFPKFDFGFELDLKSDLQKLDITNVFEEGKANLTNMSDDASLYITDAKQSSKVQFSEDGIKAAAATMVGGRGGGGNLLYIFEPPIEEIDLTFDKPFMFVIRDKNSGEVWFVGNVYEGVESEAYLK